MIENLIWNPPVTTFERRPSRQMSALKEHRVTFRISYPASTRIKHWTERHDVGVGDIVEALIMNAPSWREFTVNRITPEETTYV
jgi:hypothetical protein